MSQECRKRWGSARKKVWEAIHVLVGDGTARERLGYACFWDSCNRTGICQPISSPGSKS